VLVSDILEAFDEYLSVTKALERLTVEAYLRDLSQLEIASAKPLLQLETLDVINFLAQFDNKRTLNRKLSAINVFFDFCHRNDFRYASIKIPMARTAKSLPKYLSHDAILSSVSLIDRSTTLGLRDYALILFLYASGARISEALSVQRSDVRDGWVTIRYAKGGKERMVPLAAAASEAIADYLHAADIRSSALWLNYRGEALSRISAYKITKKYLGVSPHVLRHSFASALIIGGADLRIVQELLGHASLVTTQIYTHIERRYLSSTIQHHHPLGVRT
jgi:integrase/recombinase XerD